MAGNERGRIGASFSQRDAIVEKHTLDDWVWQSSSSNNIFTIMRDNKDRMWIATFGGGLHLGERHQGKLTFRQFVTENRHRV